MRPLPRSTLFPYTTLFRSIPRFARNDGQRRLCSAVMCAPRVKLNCGTLPDQGDEGVRHARQAAIAAVDQSEFAPELHVRETDELDLARAHLIASKAGADQRYPQARRDKAFDHP